MRRKRGPLIRRLFHISSPILLVYYLLPDDLYIGFPKVWGLTLGWAGLLITELLRFAFNLEILGLREYEKWQLSAYFWGGTAFFLGVLFFPQSFVAVGVLGMAWVDPLCGYTRKVGGYPYIPVVVYAVMAFVALWLVAGGQLERLLVLTTLATGLAIAVEYPSLTWIDDDFTVQFVPMLGMALAAMLL